MAQLLYFGSKISDNIIKTDEGYIICKNVPICRTGWQTYLGKELGDEVMKEHDLAPDDQVKVYRSPEEVFARETQASFETKPVTDNHPPNGRFVNSENFKELICGHGQNVRHADELEDGEEVMLADLVVQYKPLVEDVLSERKREISCGYDYKLRLRPDGNFEQFEIRGNHIAVVPKGRAGDKVRINDAAPAEEEKLTVADKPESVQTQPPLVKPEGMTFKKFFLGIGLKMFAQDAKPEEVAEAQDELRKEGEMPEKKSLSEEELTAKDAELSEREKKVGEREDDVKRREADARKADDRRRADDDAHPEGCRCDACPMGKDRKAKDKRADDKFDEFMGKLRDYFGSEKKDDPEDKDKDGADKKKSDDKKSDDKKSDDKKSKDDDPDDNKVDPADNPADDKKAADGLDPIPQISKKDETKNPIPGADSVMEVLRETRAIVAQSGDQSLVDRWNRARDAAVGGGSKANTRGGYDAVLSALAVKGKDSDPELSAEDRAKAYQDNLDRANSRTRKENK